MKKDILIGIACFVTGAIAGSGTTFLILRKKMVTSKEIVEEIQETNEPDIPNEDSHKEMRRAINKLDQQIEEWNEPIKTFESLVKELGYAAGSEYPTDDEPEEEGDPQPDEVEEEIDLETDISAIPVLVSEDDFYNSDYEISEFVYSISEDILYDESDSVVDRDTAYELFGKYIEDLISNEPELYILDARLGQKYHIYCAG